MHQINTPSEGNKHVFLPAGYLCQRQCLQRKTRHCLWPPCNVQLLLGAVCDNIISPCGTWISAELSAGDLPHWQSSSQYIPLQCHCTELQPESLGLPSKMSMLMPKLISNLAAQLIANNDPLWLCLQLIWTNVSFFFLFPDFLSYFTRRNSYMNICGKPRQSNFILDKENGKNALRSLDIHDMTKRNNMSS